MNGGATDERARQRRGSRDIAGEECADVSLRGIDVSIARAEAHQPRPQPDGTAGLPKPELRRSIQNPVSILLPTKMFEEPRILV